ncbi:sister chromatid cohesion protein DCC1 [Gadus chalcogrammus]|uniref:sister chromatid cohesion protein DCC1 n=1 Tax=Gadus chalcogrammus TaxID=1042646 RepID=UPI0024C4C88F|nr:sister chromatid cohesion protein DCC1 [Gadus chalcogrammus]
MQRNDNMRTLEEVQATVEIAKLQEDDLQATIHCLTFGENVLSADYCLMELDDTLCKHIEAGESLVIRGDKDEKAVLCTGDKTYDLKMADTSNLLLLVPDCKTPDQLSGSKDSPHLVQTQIWGFCSSYWELRKQRPRMKKLKQLLMENPYEGPSLRGQEDPESLYTMLDLLERIQASEQELLAQLETIHACQVDGYWRMLDFDYEMKLLGHVTQLVDSESWSFSKVPMETCLEELCSLEPREMIEHWLNCFGKRSTENERVFYALDEDKVCRATALLLLQNAVKFNLREFQEVWQQSVPEGMGTRLDQLRGYALVDRGSGPDTICLLRVEDLSEDTVERFNQLFTLREKWTEADITPYIKDLCGEKQTTAALLTKYARSSTQNGVKVFNSRRPVAT